MIVIKWKFKQHIYNTQVCVQGTCLRGTHLGVLWLIALEQWHWAWWIVWFPSNSSDWRNNSNRWVVQWWVFLFPVSHGTSGGSFSLIGQIWRFFTSGFTTCQSSPEGFLEMAAFKKKGQPTSEIWHWVVSHKDPHQKKDSVRQIPLNLPYCIGKGARASNSWAHFCDSFRGSLLIDLGCPWSLGTGCKGAFSIFVG